MSDNKNKFFHEEALINQGRPVEPVATKEYVDDQLKIVYDTFGKFGTDLDKQFTNIKDDREKIWSHTSKLNAKINNNDYYINQNSLKLDRIENVMKRTIISMLVISGLLGAGLLLTGCASSGTRFIHTSKFPITMVDIKTKAICKPLVSSFSGDRYAVSYGAPCHTELVYEEGN